jgi:glutaredoxin
MEQKGKRIQVVLYTRRECCLCEGIKQLLHKVSGDYPLDLAEVDIDLCPDLQAQWSHEIPVLFIEGRKAFKYRTTEPELRKRLNHALFGTERIGGSSSV